MVLNATVTYKLFCSASTQSLEQFVNDFLKANPHLEVKKDYPTRSAPYFSKDNHLKGSLFYKEMFFSEVAKT